jgi:hypothetical protein
MLLLLSSSLGGTQILLRKGGVREGAFAPAAHAFLMFPTAFHSQTQLLKPGIAQRYEQVWCLCLRWGCGADTPQHARCWSSSESGSSPTHTSSTPQHPHTQTHTQEMALQPKAMETLPLHVFATVTGAWTTRDPGVLAALDALHVYAEGFLDARLKWRSKDPLTLLELRAYRLAEPLLLPVGQEPERYFGCFSWLELPAKVVAAGPPCWTLQPALSDAEFAERQAVLREALRQLDAQVLELSC